MGRLDSDITVWWDFDSRHVHRLDNNQRSRHSDRVSKVIDDDAGCDDIITSGPIKAKL